MKKKLFCFREKHVQVELQSTFCKCSTFRLQSFVFSQNNHIPVC